MSDTTKFDAAPAGRPLLSKVPEITLWVCVIKILCTTVGESVADWINMTLGVGLDTTASIFTITLDTSIETAALTNLRGNRVISCTPVHRPRQVLGELRPSAAVVRRGARLFNGVR